MNKTIWRYLALALTAVPLFALPTSSAIALGGDEEDKKVVIRNLSPCPEIKFQSKTGESIQWIGRSSRGFLGVELTALTPELRQHFGVPGEAGVMIGRVVEDSAAAQAGLQVGDIITRVDGEDVTSAGGVGRAVRQKEGGEVVDVEVWRDDALQTVTVTLGEHERCAFDISQLHHLEGIDFEQLGSGAWKISEEALEALRGVEWEKAIEGLREVDWEKHFEGLRMIDAERLERQMDRTRERLEQLEERFEREHERLERLEREEREKVERLRERAERDAERDRERAEQDRERAERDLERERAELERQRERAERDRERAREEQEDGDVEI